MGAFVAGVAQRRLRRRLQHTSLQAHDRIRITDEMAAAWASEPVEVTIVAVYIAMVDLLSEAVRFMQDLLRHYGNDDVRNDVNENCLRIKCVSADAVQGETFEIVVLALPPTTREWTSYLCDPSRMLTMLSRHCLQIVVPQVHNDGNKISSPATKTSMEAFLAFQESADETWTFDSMMADLGWPSHGSDWPWPWWHDRGKKFNSMWNASEAVSVEASTSWTPVAIGRAEVPTFPTPISYRGQKLIFLRFTRSMLKMTKADPDFHSNLVEVKFKVNDKRIAAGFTVEPTYCYWFHCEFY